MFRRFTLLAAVSAMLALASSAQAASIWTPLSSGTSDTISSVVYQSPTRLWYATTNGHIATFNGTTFTQGTGITAGEDFTDLAFQPAPGTTGVAVASNGDIFRTTNSGATWAAITPHPSTRGDCTSATLAPETELNAVAFAGASTVYLLGDNGTLMKSTDSGAHFTEINKTATGTCQAQSEGSVQNLTDATFLPGNPLAGIMVAQDFGTLYGSSNGFTSGARVNGDTVNEFQGDPRVAQDPANPNRVFVVDHSPGGSGCNSGLCLEVSDDGGNTTAAAQFANDSNPTVGLYGVSAQSGTVVAAGTGGEIFTSIDGANFYNQPADGVLATENWRAEAAFDAAHAAVGGVGGALAITSAANTIPDIIAPTGTISGPTAATSGKATTYHAVLADNAGGSGINPSSITWTAPGFAAQHGAAATFTFPRGVGEVTLTVTFADNAGNQGTATLSVTVKNAPPPGPPSGSSPTTITTGGGTIKVFKVVTVTGRNARFIPIIVSATKPRKFTAQVLPAKGKKKTLATGHLTLKKKHGGHGTLRVKLTAKVKPGRYVIVVRETTLKGKRVGKLIKVTFTLK